VPGAIAVEGLRDVQKALKNADKDVRLGIRKELRGIAEPVKATAEQLAVPRIRGLRAGAPWSKMRVGVTQTMVYVVPKQRGRKRGGQPSGPRRRADLVFKDLMIDRVFEPTMYVHQDRIGREVEQMLDRVCVKFNRGL
jgi:hypothetical protein